MLTDRLIHIHVYRTGGFLFRAVLREIPGLEILNDHLHVPYVRLARMASDALGYIPPSVAFVRNPWAWYVSMWRYVTLYSKPPYQRTFAEYMVAIRDGTVDDPDYVVFSKHWQSIGADGRQYLGRFESLRKDLTEMLVTIMPDLVDAATVGKLIADSERYHPSEPWHEGPITDYAGHYDDDLRQMVEEWDGDMIEKFGYKFEGE